jgi:hypothetical protein
MDGLKHSQFAHASLLMLMIVLSLQRDRRARAARNLKFFVACFSSRFRPFHVSEVAMRVRAAC